ncbi:MAG: DUF302 domain-containing protein [Pseudomonadota bacterium]|nr:DUF302 domain-containing protein [Pseudomonadota bacterium]
MKTSYFRALYLGSIVFLFCSSAFGADDGIVTKKSKYSVNETMDRLEAVAKSKGMTIFARIDFSALGKKNLDLEIPPNQLLIWGKGRGGPNVISAAPLAALDFPLRTVAWQDSDGKVWLSYSTADHIKQRYNVEGKDKVFKKINGTLDSVTSEALK